MTTVGISTLTLNERVDNLNNALNAGDTLAAMRNVDAALNALRDIAVALIESGVHEGQTQAAMSRALGVPASALRGVSKEFSR